VLRQLAPFKGGNIGLRGLHDLDILDKHETVVPIFLVARSKMSILQGGHPLADALHKHFGMDLSGLYTPVTECSTLVLKNDIDPRSVLLPPENGPQPIFPPGLPFADELMLETLEKLSQLTSKIIDLFRGQFGNRNTDP
jgi:hypothetical protein